MAYVLKRNLEEVKEDDLRSGEFTHEPTGIEITINSFANPAYQRAYERIFLREKEQTKELFEAKLDDNCLLYTSPSPRDGLLSRMPSSA